MPKQPILVAVVDDDDIYQFTTRKSLQLCSVSNQVFPFKNGESILRFIQEGKAQTDRLPDVILLDINMPLSDGWMFLEEFGKLKSEVQKNISIYMVSSSIDPRDKNRAAENALIKSYITKPISVEKFTEILEAV